VGNGYPDRLYRNLERAIGDVESILSSNNWITEGMYQGWTVRLIYKADVVVWLDPAWPVAVWRVFYRHLRAELRRDNRFPDWFRLARFEWRTRRWYTRAPDDVRGQAETFGWARSTTEPYAKALGVRMIRAQRLTPTEVLEHARRLLDKS
jgi:hypothetical protein